MSKPVNLEIVSRMPWLVAEDMSIWEASGTYRGGGGFTNCLVIAGYFEGHLGFFHISPYLQGEQIIAPDRISRATLLELAEATS